MNRQMGLLGICGLLLATLLGCAGLPFGPGAVPQSHGGSVRDQVSFLDQLRGRGLTVTITGEARHPRLNQPGTAVQLSGATLTAPYPLELFEFASTGEAGAALPAVRPLTKATAPTIFLRERLLVMAQQPPPAVVSLLTELLGPAQPA